MPRGRRSKIPGLIESDFFDTKILDEIFGSFEPPKGLDITPEPEYLMMAIKTSVEKHADKLKFIKGEEK